MVPLAFGVLLDCGGGAELAALFPAGDAEAVGGINRESDAKSLPFTSQPPPALPLLSPFSNTLCMAIK